VASSFDELRREKSNHLVALGEQTMAFLRDESGISGVEYAAFGIIIVLGILVVLKAVMKTGNLLVQVSGPF
jgi:Flp pilus assembly pilin Flp